MVMGNITNKYIIDSMECVILYTCRWATRSFEFGFVEHGVSDPDVKGG